MMMNDYTIHNVGSKPWNWCVSYKGGAAICRTKTKTDAKRIAYALAAQRQKLGLDDPLTKEELAVVKSQIKRS